MNLAYSTLYIETKRKKSSTQWNQNLKYFAKWLYTPRGLKLLLGKSLRDTVSKKNNVFLDFNITIIFVSFIVSLSGTSCPLAAQNHVQTFRQNFELLGTQSCCVPESVSLKYCPLNLGNTFRNPFMDTVRDMI